ncbi:MAG: hypothetical protein HWD82_10380 [Flavobacteriaceae bacterium]|nr:hypothetical protein [Flavobacteriaceae bacterium]
MIFRKKIAYYRFEHHRNTIIMMLFSLFFFFISSSNFAQDSIPEKEDLTEAAELKFQEFFFNALSQKAIGNYSKAIELLENCNQILPNNKTVYFEFSKNYLELNNTQLAKEYIDRAIAKDEANIWMLKHLIAIYVKHRNYNAAIDTQKKVIALNPKEKPYLIRLYLYNRDYKEAVDLMNVLEKENALSSNLKMLKKSLEARKDLSQNTVKVTDINSLMADFEKNKTYKVLDDILKKSSNNINILLKYSSLGIELYPAQAYLYLVKAKVLNNQKKYKEAINVLQNGIDFVLEISMEIDFFKEFAKAYNGLGNIKEEKKYNAKIQKLKS